ncbi:MAG: branched-chain amino acid transporter AzlC [Oscillospiraceae bacterium]|jgi:4-azaleucine resistance transporter AzlC|nr:branched-chain amino acid transporter AzlC [Oscillospiraceae bacterium]
MQTETETQKSIRRRAFSAAFPHTIPILAGFLFLGISYGLYATAAGFDFWYPILMAVVIFGGSLEFVAVEMLLGIFAPAQTLIMALMIQARHLFYGIAMLEKYKGTGWKKVYLIYGMCDESFSINCSAEIPEGVDKGWFMFFVTLLNQLYWVCGTAVGAVLGSVISFDLNGLEFVMTAMFVVIFLDQWLKEKKHYTGIIGVAASAVCLLAFGADSFMIPTMTCILCLLTVFRGPIEKAGGLG